MKKKIGVVLTVAAASVFAVTHLSAQTQEQLEQRAEQLQQQKYEVMQINTELFQGSAQAISKYVADDAVFTSSIGVPDFDKADWLKQAKSDKKRLPVKLNVIQVTPQGDTAVVFGFVTAKEQKGKSLLTRKVSFLNVFAKRNNRWQLIAQQTANQQL